MAGMVKGVARRFITGHHRRMIPIPEGRYRRRNGTKEHIAIAERALGKSLPALAKVHHVDGSTTRNANSNLVICENQAYHLLLHARGSA